MKYNKKNSNEPIAIVGMAFRFPGDICNEQQFWALLEGGQDAISQISSDRWATDELQHTNRSEPGRSVTFSAGVLSQVAGFDASFFGISPREAAWLDPQQRLLLELAWEAMEDSGTLPQHLAGSNCAVFIGMSSLDYGVRGVTDLASITSHSMTGNTLSMAANRISYTFDLHGPSLTVDTACSSALVALHQACRSLRSGETPCALVGSANLLLHPYPFVGFTKASMISANGRCRTFDATADGYVRSEGGAMLVLKPLSQAQADNDPIHAVIMASGVNADGGRKTGITIPSSEGQADLMHDVIKAAGITAEQLDYLEAHGTGTAVGDPIETRAIGKVYGQNRSTPLPIGSVKTNLGHLEAASGMAGLIKTILMLKHRVLPPSLHCVNPNPNIAFTELNLQVVTQRTELPGTPKNPAIMAVNSFGFGGTNAHAILHSHIPSSKRPGTSAKKTTPPLFLSARTDEALRELAGRYSDYLQSPDAPAYYDIAYSAAFHRQSLEKRLALPFSDSATMGTSLKRFSQQETIPGMTLESTLADPGPVAFVYTGNGAHWVGMGRQLLKESKRFAAVMKQMDEKMATQAGFSLLDEIHAGAEASRLNDTAIAQPLLFALQVAITTMLREQGVEAGAVIGHSVGEVAAAWASGALSLEDAIEVVCARSAAQAKTAGDGRMAAVGMSEQSMRDILSKNIYSTIEIAGINSHTNITLSGKLEELLLLEKELKSSNTFFHLLDLDYAFHSQSMDKIKSLFLGSLEKIHPQPCTTPFVSTVTGNVLEGTALTCEYWWHNVRKPVQFSSGIQALIGQGYRVFVEIGPHAILQRYINECLATTKITGRVLATLRRDDDRLARINDTILAIHLLAKQPNLKAYFLTTGRFVPLPNYPWQHEDYWLPKTSESYAIIERKRVHPLLGWRLKEQEAAWENVIDEIQHPYLADHQITGTVVFPAAAYIEMALAAAREWYGGEEFELEQFEILSPIILENDHARSMRVELSPRDGMVRIYSRTRLSDDAWNLHATCRLLGAPTQALSSSSAHHPATNSAPIDASTHYHLTNCVGLEYGNAFQGFLTGSISGDRLTGKIALPELLHDAEDPHIIHPVLLDSCFQSLVHFFRSDIEAGKGVQLLPVKVGRLRYYGGTHITGFHMQLKHHGHRSVRVDIVLVNAKGESIGLLEGCVFRFAPIQRRKVHEPARWRMKTKLIPHPMEDATSSALSGTPWSECARDWLAQPELQAPRQAYFENAVPLSSALVTAFIYEAFHLLQTNHPALLKDALNNGSVVPYAHRHFFAWLVRCLKDNSLLRNDKEGWVMDEANAPPPAKEIWRTLLAEYPEMIPELLFVGRIGRWLPNIFTDTQATKLLSSIEESHLMEPLFDDALPYVHINRCLRETLNTMCRNWPKNKRLRILQISGGSSELPHQLASDLCVEHVDYVIAEANNERLSRLKAEYHAHPFVKVATVDDTDLSLTAETTLPELFDIVILHHWLHRCPQSAALLSQLRRKMVCGGQLILAERHPNYVTDYIFGTAPHWWREKENFVSSSLLSPDEWASALLGQGFERVETVTEPADANIMGGAYLLFAANTSIPASLTNPASTHWVLICDSMGISKNLGDILAAKLAASDQQVTLAIVGPNTDTLATTLKRIHYEKGLVNHIVYLAGMHGQEPIFSSNAPDEDARCIGLLHLTQALTQQGESLPKLWLVTTGGALISHAEEDGITNPLEAPLWGFGRVIMNEYPELACTLIDVAFDSNASEVAQRLEHEFLRPDGEREIILTSNARFGLRMQSDRIPVHEQQEHAPRFRLDFQVPGQLRNLHWLSQDECALKDDEIEVKPAAVGLNFRDVMYSMGLLPDEAVENGFSGATLGLEFAGTVCRIGRNVTEYNVGDAVMGFGPACFASHIVTKAGAITPKPQSWSFAQAATVPTAFFTVYYALKHLAALQPGEKLLVHGAAGGVGIAAIQIGKYLGAEIFATAGSDEKRDFVDLLGADHVLDSRSLAFADDILALTNGEGVDVVLNSLAGEAINRNFSALKPFGRFLELGKRDFYENTHIGLRPFKDNISYFGIDADQLLLAKPALASSLFREMMSLFHEEKLSPLPYRTFSAERIVEAFRHMQQSRHIGKIIVEMDTANVQASKGKRADATLRLREDATYLVTGGLTGFGLESSRWLAEHGAKHLVLLSRRGMHTPDAEDAISALEALGTKVRVFACDITNYDELENVFSQIKKECPPLRGILHAAMVLDDGLIQNLDDARFVDVLSPKMLGAWNLHHLSQSLQLDYFILYSSITTYIGNPGQANYVAANAYLEAFASWRRTNGLPAHAISWGPIGDTGYLSRNTAVKDSLAARLGAKPLDSKQALACLERILLSDAHHTAVADFDFSVLSRLLPSAQGPRFEWLRQHSDIGDACDGDTMDIQSLIAGKSQEEIKTLIQQLMLTEAGKILSVCPERIDATTPMHNLGMDSLMAVELVMAIEQRFGIHFSAMELSGDSNTVERISMKIAEKLCTHEPDVQGDKLVNLAGVMAAQHAEDYSPEELLQTVDDLKQRATQNSGAAA